MFAYREGASKEQINSITSKHIDSAGAEALYYWLYEAGISRKDKKAVLEILAETPNSCREIDDEFLSNYESYRNLGLSSHDAAILCGVTEAQIQRWLKGRDIDSERFKQLLYIESSADARLKHSCLRTIMDSVDTGNVKSATWLLERRFPAEYGQRQSLNIDTNQEIVVTRNVHEEKALQAREQLRKFREQRGQTNGND